MNGQTEDFLCKLYDLMDEYDMSIHTEIKKVTHENNKTILHFNYVIGGVEIESTSLKCSDIDSALNSHSK